MGKSKIRPFIIAGCSILVIGLIIGIYFYATTDFLKSPKKLFTKYLSQTFSIIEPTGLDAYNNVEKNKLQNNYKEGITINFDLTNGLSQVQGKKNGYTLRADYEKDITNNKAKAPLSLYYKNHELLNGNLIINNDLIGVNINGLTEKPIAVKNSNLKGLYDNLGIENSGKYPNTISKINFENLNMTENLTNIFTKYVEHFDDKFDKDSFAKEKKINIVIENNEYTANRYTLYTTIFDFYSFIRDEAGLMKSDDSLKSFIQEKFNISSIAVDEFLDNIINKSNELIDNNEHSKIISVYVYEKDGKLLKIEASTDSISYEMYVYKLDNLYKLLFYYNNIELVTRRTNETLKLVIENEFDNGSQDVMINYFTKYKNKNQVEGNMAEYIENDYKILYNINNVSDTGADKTMSYIFNNKKLVEIKTKITIGTNVEVENISSDNVDVINDMSAENLRNLISTLTENAASFIDVSNIVEEEPEVPEIIDTSTLDSAIKDLNSTFAKIAANYNLDSEGTEKLKDYFDGDKLVNNSNFGNELLLDDEKKIILYRNKENQTYRFNISISDYAIQIVNYEKLEGVEEISLQDILYPPPEPEPEPEPEIEDVPHSDTLATMRTEIESYLAAVYNEAVTTGEEIVAADYINADQIVLNCASVISAYVEEQEGGTFYIECTDNEEKIYSGIIQITEDNIKLLMFN